MDENPTWNSTWQVWTMLTEIVGNFFGTTLEGRPGRKCDGPRGTTHDNLSKIHIPMLFMLNLDMSVGGTAKSCLIYIVHNLTFCVQDNGV